MIALYDLLDDFLNSRQEYQRGQELDRFFLNALEKGSVAERPAEKQEEWLRVLFIIGNRHLKLKQYADARACYEQTLQLLEHTALEKSQRSAWQASTYHNLGIVAQEQRQWEQAEQYYQ